MNISSVVEVSSCSYERQLKVRTTIFLLTKVKLNVWTTFFTFKIPASWRDPLLLLLHGRLGSGARQRDLQVIMTTDQSTISQSTKTSNPQEMQKFSEFEKCELGRNLSYTLLLEDIYIKFNVYMEFQRILFFFHFSI